MKSNKFIFGLVGVGIFFSCLCSGYSCYGCVNNDEKISFANKEVDGSEIYNQKFWSDKVGDSLNKILMSPDEIAKLNKEICENPETGCIDLDAYPKHLSKKELLAELTKEEMPKGKRYIGDREIGLEYYENLFKNRNESLVQDDNEVKYGLVVQNTQIRTYPTSDVSYSEPNDIEFDLNCETGLKIGDRILVLHTSTDGKYYFVKTYNYTGWVKVEDVALCNEDEWKKYGSPENFLIVTGDKIELDVNLYNKKISKAKFTMGTKLPLIDKKPLFVDGVSTKTSYVVLLPTRDEDGYCKLCNARVPFNKDCSIGYLQYTQDNVLKQVFKMLGNLYGWSDLWDTRDCSSLAMDVYRTFGLNLPRNSSKQIAVKTSVDVSKMSLKEKKEFIMSQPVGTLLYMPGHVMMFIGNYNDDPYVIHASYASFSAKKEKLLNNCVVVTDLNILKYDGTKFIDNINFVSPLKK